MLEYAFCSSTKVPLNFFLGNAVELDAVVAIEDAVECVLNFVLNDQQGADTKIHFYHKNYKIQISAALASRSIDVYT